MMPDLSHHIFTNADQEIVEYDGSPVTWRVSAYALVTQGENLLIIKNRHEKLYDIVGGGIELGETITEALAREAIEEAGASLDIGTLLHAEVGWFFHRTQQQFYQTLQLFYEARLVGSLREPTESSTEWRGFVPISEIEEKYPLPPVVLTAIRLLNPEWK